MPYFLILLVVGVVMGKPRVSAFFHPSSMGSRRSVRCACGAQLGAGDVNQRRVTFCGEANGFVEGYLRCIDLAASQ